MSQSLCVRCLRRSLSPSNSRTNSYVVSRAAFSTTPIFSVHPGPPRPIGKGKTLVLARNKRVTGRHPAPGERMAFKKRIVLSNTNALEVKELQDLGMDELDRIAEHWRERRRVVSKQKELAGVARRAAAWEKRALAWEKNEIDSAEGVESAQGVESTGEIESAEGIKSAEGIEPGDDVLEPVKYTPAPGEGQMRGFSDETVDALRALEAFQPRQAWSLFRRPATVMRHETTELADIMRCIETAEDADSKSQSIVLDGQRASGKSVLLLQALAMAHLKGWIVIHLPVAKDLINAHTSYAPIQTPEGTRYIQPHYTARLLTNIAKANGKVLSTMQLSKEHELPVPVPENISLDRFALLGADDPALAWPIFQALWSELTTLSNPDQEGLQRPPILMGLDGLSCIMSESAYLDAEAQPIHAHDLMLVQTFVSALSKQTVPPNGGLTIAAMSGSDRPQNQTVDFCLDAYPKKEAAYFPYDKRVMDTLGSDGILVWKIHGISKEEARAVMEYWARSGILRATVTEGLVSDKWSLSGGGIIGEMERAAVRSPYYAVR